MGADRSGPSQAVEQLKGEADQLEKQLAQALANSNLLRDQCSSLQQAGEAATAQKGELLGRCRDLEMHLGTANANRDAAVARLIQVKSVATEVSLARLTSLAVVCSPP